MRWAEVLSEVHFQASAMALQGLLKLANLKRENFVQATGVTEDYVSHVAHGRRRPGLKILRGVRRTAALPDDFRVAFTYFIEEARRFRGMNDAAIRSMVSEEALRDQVPVLREIHARILFGRKAPEQIYRAQRALFGTSRERFLAYGDALLDPESYIQLCAIAVDAGLATGSIFEVLPVALLAYAIADSLYDLDSPPREPGSSSPWLDALRLRGMAHFEMGMFDDAYKDFVRGEESKPVRDRPDILIPHTTRDVLRTMAKRRRSSIKEARQRAKRAREMARGGAYDSASAELLCLLLDTVMVRCQVAYARRVPAAATVNLSEAASLLDPYESMMQKNEMKDASPLHRVMYFRAQAAIDWATYERRLERRAKPEELGRVQLDAMNETRLGHHLRLALAIGREAGLWNQLGKIAFEYPWPVTKLAEEEGLRPYGEDSTIVAFRLCRCHHYCPPEPAEPQAAEMLSRSP